MKLDNTKRTRGTKASYKKKSCADKEERMTSGVTGVVVLPESISVSDLSEKILISSAEIIKILMSYGIMANINQTIDFETAGGMRRTEILRPNSKKKRIFTTKCLTAIMPMKTNSSRVRPSLR